MTDKLYFDTDCISPLLLLGKENILLELYRTRIVLPQQVFIELCKVNSIRAKIGYLQSRSEIEVQPIIAGTPESDLYFKLTASPAKGFKTIGRGEASAIALTKVNNGILASNNFKDIMQYIKLYGLKYTTSADILVEAFNNGLIEEYHGNVIWKNMLQMRRFLPTKTFSEYLDKYR
jgi:predicted nucleic acid-binding protein